MGSAGTHAETAQSSPTSIGSPVTGDGLDRRLHVHCAGPCDPEPGYGAGDGVATHDTPRACRTCPAQAHVP